MFVIPRSTPRTETFGIALFGLIVLHGGLCPHMKIETVLNLIVVERGSVHVVIVVEQVRRMWRVTPFIRRMKSAVTRPSMVASVAWSSLTVPVLAS